MKLRFPAPFQHKHPPVVNVNQQFAEVCTAGQRVADAFARAIGSWTFIVIQSMLLALWVALNVVAWVKMWDPYPFILLNLMLSFQAAYAAPIIMMSQNRQSQRDRLDARNDYLINLKAEEELRAVLENQAAQNVALQSLLQVMDAITLSLGVTTPDQKNLNGASKDTNAT